MKKIIIILVLLISTFFISNNSKVSVEKINLSLQENELGIIFININNNNGLLLSLNNKNILYLIKYSNYDDIFKYLNPLNINIDYTIMNSDYNVVGNKIVFNDYLYLNNITFNKKDYIIINYNDQTLCINPTYNNCDYIYYTYDTKFYINDYTKIFIYNDIINKDKFYDKWVDSYKISKNNYTILKIKDTYEVLEIPKNI